MSKTVIYRIYVIIYHVYYAACVYICLTQGVSVSLYTLFYRQMFSYLYKSG